MQSLGLTGSLWGVESCAAATHHREVLRRKAMVWFSCASLWQLNPSNRTYQRRRECLVRWPWEQPIYAATNAVKAGNLLRIARAFS
jgi:hypothetical protein